MGLYRAKNKAKIAGPTVQTLGITLLLNVSSTTEPIRRHIGSVVELTFNTKEPYEWTDTIPEDDPEFRGLLEEEAPFPDVSAELPGVILEEEEEGGHQVMTNEPNSASETLAAAALDNAGINTTKQIRAARATADVAAKAHATTQAKGPRLIEANEDKIVYEIKFDFPDDGIISDYNAPAELPDAAITDGDTATNHYPMQSHRSVFDLSGMLGHRLGLGF